MSNKNCGGSFPSCSFSSKMSNFAAALNQGPKTSGPYFIACVPSDSKVKWFTSFPALQLELTWIFSPMFYWYKTSSVFIKIKMSNPIYTSGTWADMNFFPYVCLINVSSHFFLLILWRLICLIWIYIWILRCCIKTWLKND